jgi:hypothetical protein
MDYRKKNSKASKLATEAKEKAAAMMIITQNSPLELDTKQRQKSVSTKVERRIAVVRNPAEDEFPMMRSLIKFI